MSPEFQLNKASNISIKSKITLALHVPISYTVNKVKNPEQKPRKNSQVNSRTFFRYSLIDKIQTFCRGNGLHAVLLAQNSDRLTLKNMRAGKNIFGLYKSESRFYTRKQIELVNMNSNRQLIHFLFTKSRLKKYVLLGCTHGIHLCFTE